MSVKTVAQKLLIKPGTSWWLSEPSHEDLLQPLPEDASPAVSAEDAGVRLLFADSGDALRVLLDKHGKHLLNDGVTWIAYPKANKADINRDTLWPIAGEHGLRPIGQVAIDDTWSALRFRPLKEGEEQFTGGKKK